MFAEHVTTKHLVKWIVVAMLIVLGIIIVYLVSVGDKPYGVIFVSSSSNSTDSLLTTYAVAVNGSGPEIVGMTSTSVGDFYSFSRDKTTVAFVGTTQSRLQQFTSGQLPAGSVMQVYRAPVTQGSVPSPNLAEQLTSSNGKAKEMPSVSDDGSLVAYVVVATSSQSVDTSIIHLVGPQGDRALFEGIDPQWYSDTSFYYIAPDGVRLYDTAASSSILVLPVKGQSNFKLSLSPDRRILAFSDPDARAVYFYAIGTNGVTLSPLKTLNGVGFWTVFSPDSRFVAIQTAQDSGGSLNNPSLVIYDSSSFTQVGTVSLGTLLNDRLFVTAWIQ